MTAIANQLKDAIISESKKHLSEGVVRIKKCLAQVNEEQVWNRPNENSNSIGNQVLHLCGNVRQWILSGIDGQKDTRNRDAEFLSESAVSKTILIEQLEALMKEVVECLDKISPEELLRKRKVQAYEETGIGILIHVVEHFSYHVGQITYIVKSTQDMDMGYYADVDLNQKG